MNKTFLAVIAVSIVALGIAGVAAYGNGFGGVLSDENRALIGEHREAMQNAVETGDYESWSALMQERVSRMQSEISEENFQAMQERHQERAQIREQFKEAFASGDEEAIQALQGQYGSMGAHRGSGFGGQKGMRMGGFDGNCPYADSD